VIAEVKTTTMQMPLRRGATRLRYSSESIGRVLFGLYCLDAALDFRSSQDSSNGFQIALGVFSILAFTLFALNARRTRTSLPLLRRTAWLWWVYLATTPMIAYLRGYQFTHYLRVALPQFLMGTSLMMGYILLSESKANAGLIFKGLFYASLCSSIVHLIHGLTMGLSIENLRYYIASPLLIVTVSFALYRLLFEGARSGRLNLIALAGGLSIVFFTVTRSYFVSIASVLLGIGLVLVRPPGWLKKSLRRRIIWNLVLLSAVFGGIGIALVIAFPEVLSHWSSRSSTLGSQDSTTLIRISEAAGEIEAMRSDTSHLLLGSGIGSDHTYDERYLIGMPEAKAETTGVNYSPGHIGWIYQFYTSGLLFGWVYLFVFAVSIWKGNSREAPYVARMAGITVIAVFVTSTMGNMLGDRASGLGIGLLIALSMYGAESTGKAPKKRRIVRRRIPVLNLRRPVVDGHLPSGQQRLNQSNFVIG
jgi:hypothetical protein